MPGLAALLSFCVITAFTPGPNNIMAMSIAGQHGQRQSLRFCTGVLLGFLLIMSACALGSMTLYRHFPGLEPGLRAMGALYLAWLAWGMFKAGQRGSAAPETRAYGIVSGMLLQFVNPKVIIYGMTAFSTFIAPWGNTHTELLLFALLLAGMGFLGTYCWSVGGTAFRNCFTRHPQATNSVLALLMLYCAFSLVF